MNVWRPKSSGPRPRATITDRATSCSCGMKWLTTFHAPPRTTDSRVVTPNWSSGRATVGLCHTIAVSMAGPAAADTPALAVIVASMGRTSAASTVESILSSAAAVTARVDVVLVWQAAGPAPSLPSGGRVIRIVPAGVSHARNVGAARSQAELLAFVDDDVVAELSWVGSVLAAFDEGADAVSGPVQSPGNRTATDDEPGPVARWYRGRTARPWTIGDRRNVAVRRRLFDALGGFDVRMGPGTFGRSGEGAELMVGLLALGARVRWRPDMAVCAPVTSPAERTTSAGRAGFGVGRVVRRQRAAAMAAAYALDLGRAVVRAAGAGDRAALRELSAAGRGLVAGLATGDRWTSPPVALDRLPDGVRDTLAGRRLHPWPVPHRSPPHFMWAAGADLVLHLYTDAANGFSAGRAARGGRRCGRRGRSSRVGGDRRRRRRRLGGGGAHARPPGPPLVVGHGRLGRRPRPCRRSAVGRHALVGGRRSSTGRAASASPPSRPWSCTAICRPRTCWWTARAHSRSSIGSRRPTPGRPATTCCSSRSRRSATTAGATSCTRRAGGWPRRSGHAGAQPPARRRPRRPHAAGRHRGRRARLGGARNESAARALGMPPQPARFAPLAATSAYSDS